MRTDPTPPVSIHPLSALRQAHAAGGRLYHEFLRAPSLSTGLYVLPAGSEDPQKPHKEDEIYYVISGRARFKSGSDDWPVSTGDTIYVAATQDHRFHAITEDLVLLVMFAPAEIPNT